MKRIMTTMLIIVSIVMTMSSGIIMATSETHIYDTAGYMSSTEQAQLNARIDSLIAEYQIDIVVATVEKMSGTTSNYADNVYDENEHGIGTERDGLLLLIVGLNQGSGNRDVYLLTQSKGMYVFTDARRESMFDDIIPHLVALDVYKGCEIFLDDFEYYVNNQASSEEVSANISVANRDDVMEMGWFYLVPLIISIVVVVMLYKQLGKVKEKTEAMNYVDRSSLKINRSRDTYLYKNVTKVRIESNSGGSRGGGGGSRGGGGRRF